MCRFFGLPRLDSNMPNSHSPLAAPQDRVCPSIRTAFAAYSAISDSGLLRIKEVAISLNSPHQSINALMQYLKRKRLVAKVGQEFDAPYSLTETGRATLAEMTLRHAA